MAYKHSIKTDPASEVWRLSLGKKHFWNLTSNVGWGCENRKDDVQLIQYLLFRITWGTPVSLLPGQKYIAADGLFGPQTNNYIRSFQQHWSHTPIDGKVHTGDGINYYTKNGSAFTIHSMNNYFYEDNEKYYSDLRMDEKLPSVLCQSLSEWY
ncbi:MAG: hypothetical protein ABI954_12655 [Pyrinomonadaceae bacterium]